MVKSKLPPRSGFGLEAGEPHPQKWAIKFFFWSSFIFYFRGNYKRSNISFPPSPFRYDNISTIEREYLIFCSIFALTRIVLQFSYYLEQWFWWRNSFEVSFWDSPFCFITDKCTVASIYLRNSSKKNQSATLMNCCRFVLMFLERETQCSCLILFTWIFGWTTIVIVKHCLERLEKLPMGLKQISTLEIEIYESINNLNPSIMKEITLSQI